MSIYRRADSIRQLRQKSGTKCSSCATNRGISYLALLIVIGFCIAQIAVGFTYLQRCPAQPIVPAFLIVGGVVNILFSFTFRPLNMSVIGDMIFCEVRREGIIILVMGIISVSWLVIGTIFIFRTYGDIDNCSSTTTAWSTTAPYLNVTYYPLQNITTTTPCPFCEQTLLTITFVVMITEWCVVSIAGLAAMSVYCFVLIWALTNDEE